MVIGLENGKINLSIKRLEPKPQRDNGGRGGQPRRDNRENGQGSRQPRTPAAPPAPKTADQTFEEKLMQFMTESDSKISSIKQYSEHRTKSRRR